MDTSKASSKMIELQAGLMDNSRLCPAVKAAENRRTPKPSAHLSSSSWVRLPSMPSLLTRKRQLNHEEHEEKKFGIREL